MKLDMGKTWNQATALLKGNAGLVATMVGLYYFLPSFAIALFVPEIANPTPPAAPPGTDPQVAMEAMVASMQEAYLRGWPYFLVMTIAQYIGAVSVLSLFPERGGATVGEAMAAGLRGAGTYFVTQILFILGAGIVFGALVGLTFALSPALGVIVGFILFIGLIYVSIKLILVPAVIGMERQLNPIAAMKRSWALSKGNSLLIFIFLLVLFIVIGLISLLVSLVLTTVLAAFGGQIATIGTALISSLTSAALGGLFLVVLAAIHRQLSAPADRQDIEAFD